MTENIGDRFQKETKYFRGDLPGGRLNWQAKPSSHKTYDTATAIALPPPQTENGPPIWTTISRRRSIRNFSGASISQAQLSQLLWACQGITRREFGHEFRAAPSAGALYPVETYLAVFHLQDTPPGLYYYAVGSHALRQIRAGDLRQSVARAALDQDFLAAADVVFLWTAVFERSKWKYRQRAYRYVYLDAGHIAQNLALAATSLGLGSCQIAALYDDEANGLLRIDGEEESILYMSAVGQPA